MKIGKNCPHCNLDDWREEPIFEVLNPNGEFVEGYGCTLVSIQTGTDYHCQRCNYKLGDKVKHIPLDDRFGHVTMGQT